MSSQKKSSKKQHNSMVKGRPEKVACHGLMKPHSLSTKSGADSLRHFIGLIKPIIAERDAIVASRKLLSDSKIDIKGDPLQSRVAANVAQLALLRSTVQSTFGDRPVKFRLPISYNFPATYAAAPGAVVSSVAGVTPTTSSEWTALAGLFDEFKVTSGHMSFNCNFQSPESTNTVSTGLDTTCWLVLAYDPSDGNPLSSTATGCQTDQHELYGTMVNDARSASACTKVVFYQSSGRPYEFRFHVPRGVMVAANTGALYGEAGAWAPTYGSAVASLVYFGYVKTYVQTQQQQTTQNAIAAMLYLDVELRMRQ